jgi:hypothetical protein
MGVPEATMFDARSCSATRIAVSIAAVRPIPSITSLPVTAMIRLISQRRATPATPPRASDHCLTLLCGKPALKHGSSRPRSRAWMAPD